MGFARQANTVPMGMLLFGNCHFGSPTGPGSRGDFSIRQSFFKNFPGRGTTTTIPYIVIEKSKIELFDFGDYLEKIFSKYFFRNFSINV